MSDKKTGLTLRKTSLRVLNNMEVVEVAGAYVHNTLQPSPTIISFPGNSGASCTFCVQTMGGCDISGTGGIGGVPDLN